MSSSRPKVELAWYLSVDSLVMTVVVVVIDESKDSLIKHRVGVAVPDAVGTGPVFEQPFLDVQFEE